MNPKKKSPNALTQVALPAFPGLLRITGAGLDPLMRVDQSRAELRRLWKEGRLDKITLTAVVFRAHYPNANFFRFRDEDLPAFAESFAEAPFLRNHDITDVDARAGTIRESWLVPDPTGGTQIVQEIDITVPRDIEAVLNEQIDRFSISWFWDGITCTVCGQDWYSCSHWPGKTYPPPANTPPLVGGAGGGVCELVFESPRGRETSAVNTPAVIGTGIESVTLQENPMEPEPVYNVAPPEPPANGVIGGSAPPSSIVNGPSSGDEIAELLTAQRVAVCDARLAASGLPPEIAELVHQSLRPGWRLDDLDRAIDRARDAWARLEEKRTVTGHPARISGMQTGLDQLTDAFEALATGKPPRDGAPRLSGLREFYLLLSGDHGMTGMFQPDNVGLANVTTTTMASIVANVLNKVVAAEFQVYPQWWRPIVRTENFATLQTIRWITLGGVGELPTVAEGAAYTELTWDDKYETSSWVKKGGYLGLTLEAMDTDDVGRLRSAPRALAQAGWLTLGKAVSDVFTYNSGVGHTLIDTGALFNATAVSSTGGHANLGTSALSAASWAAAKLAMRKQAEVNSGERLGPLTSPRYLIVPPDLENTALTILASENMPGGANNDVNPEAAGASHDARLDAARRRVIVVDLWTDTNNWAASAEPSLYPTIGLGFRYGDAPEIFSVASPNSGLMFTNDVFPVKVRWYYAVGAIDFRGLYKANVS
jgi:hypothetical protein